eukprot:1595857-Pleurochrysis_carterae.AAC.1
MEAQLEAEVLTDKLEVEWEVLCKFEGAAEVEVDEIAAEGAVDEFACAPEVGAAEVDDVPNAPEAAEVDGASAAAAVAAAAVADTPAAVAAAAVADTREEEATMGFHKYQLSSTL